MSNALAYSSTSPNAILAPTPIRRRDLRPDDVSVSVTFCGVCHTDLHALHGLPDAEGNPLLVPGHEFVGTISAIGDKVTEFAVGDPVAVGNIVDSCGTCDMCLRSQENFCREFPTLTYGGTDRIDGTATLGGYSTDYVVRDAFVYHRPQNLDPAAVAPLMCAGITVWEPLRRWNVGAGTRLGVVGLGGLGHLAVRLGVALGATVSVFTTSESKTADALALGASRVVVSTDPDAMTLAHNSLDLIIDTVSAPHDLRPYIETIGLDGTLCTLGYLGEVTIDVLSLLIGRKSISSAGSGGHRHTQEMLDFCGKHSITADVEVVESAQVNVALERLKRNDVRYRFVLDLADLQQTKATMTP